MHCVCVLKTGALGCAHRRESCATSAVAPVVNVQAQAAHTQTEQVCWMVPFYKRTPRNPETTLNQPPTLAAEPQHVCIHESCHPNNNTLPSSQPHQWLHHTPPTFPASWHLPLSLSRSSTRQSRACMAFSLLPGQTLVPRHHQSRAAAPALKQNFSSSATSKCSNFHRQSTSRRQQLLSTGTALLYGQVHQHLAKAAAATAVFHEVSISASQTQIEDPRAEPYEDPPTYVTATGRIIASECLLLRQQGQHGWVVVLCRQDSAALLLPWAVACALCTRRSLVFGSCAWLSQRV